MEQQTRVISELHKKLAPRFVYAELKIKFDFKIAQPPVTAQRVTFFFHLCLLPVFAQQLSQPGLQAQQDFPTRVAGKNPWLGSCRNMLMKGCSALPTALDIFFSKTNTAAKTTPVCSSLAHQVLWYFMKILEGACRFTVLRSSPSHFTLHGALLLHLPYPRSTQQRKI